MENVKFISCINCIRALKEENIPYSEFANALGIQVCTVQKRIKSNAIISNEDKIRLREYFHIDDAAVLCKNKIIKLEYYKNDKITNIIRNPRLEEFYIGTQLVRNLWDVQNTDSLKLISMPGDKMEGPPSHQFHIRSRDVLLMDTSLTNINFNGIYAYETLGGTKIQVSHVSVNDDGTTRFYYTNPMYKEQFRTPERLKELEFKVVGKIIKNISFLHK